MCGQDSDQSVETIGNIDLESSMNYVSNKEGDGVHDWRDGRGLSYTP